MISIVEKLPLYPIPSSKAALLYMLLYGLPFDVIYLYIMTLLKLYCSSCVTVYLYASGIWLTHVLKAKIKTKIHEAVGSNGSLERFAKIIMNENV